MFNISGKFKRIAFIQNRNLCNIKKKLFSVTFDKCNVSLVNKVMSKNRSNPKV